jgi:phosphate transport system substrate-binding protein
MKRVLHIALGCALALVTIVSPALSQSNEGLDMQAARAKIVKERGAMISYTRKWDISGIPQYAPRRAVSGKIRMWGSNYITDGALGGYWEAAFLKYHPAATFEWHMKGAGAAVPSLIFGVSDIGIGPKITFANLELFQRYTDRDPLEIMLATGSYDVPGWNPGFGIIVNTANPIAHLTMRQLDGIFGSERSGGWEGTSWRPQNARGPEGNIRTWGQLGLNGEWADKPIHVYGLNLRYHQSATISDKILGGSDKWNEHLKIYANYVAANGVLERGLNEDLSNDPYGIAYIAAPISMRGRRASAPNLKILDVAARDGGPYIPYTMETLQARTYPLVDEIYAYADRGPGRSADPKVVEFLRFVVSREGQAEVMRDGKYLPLTAEVARAQLSKLEAL